MFNSLSCFSDTYLIIYRERKKQEEQIKRTDETERERTMAKGAADLSPVPRLASAPSAASTVLTIANRSPPHPIATSPMVSEGRPPRPLLGDVIATPRHHLGTDRPATSIHRASPRRSAILPASSSSPPSGGEGRAESQPGRATLSRSPCRPSPPCRGASAYWRTPPERGRAAGCHLRAARVVFEKVCFGIFFTVVSL